jgi:hypothetical protein
MHGKRFLKNSAGTGTLVQGLSTNDDTAKLHRLQLPPSAGRNLHDDIYSR